MTISGTTVATSDGDISYVDLTVSDYYAVWKGFDVPVAAVAFEDVLEGPDGTTHTLYDQLADGNGPVQLKNISSKGQSSDGWGGGDEYASKTADTSTYIRADGPANVGYVHAGVFWRILDEDGNGAHSIEDPAITNDFVPDNGGDGTTSDTTLTMHKTVRFYTLEDNGSTGVTANDGTTIVYPMGADDGTRASVTASPSFTISVENKADSTSTSGTGTTSGG